MRKILIFLFVFVLTVSFWAGSVTAKEEQEIPEIDGIYDVPDHPNLKVRVFVHGPKTDLKLTTACLDPDSTATDSATAWHLPLGNWNYILNTSSVPLSIGAANLQILAGNAFTTWFQAINKKVTFNGTMGNTPIRASLDGQNSITWGRTQGTALAVTYTWYYKSTGLVVETDTIFNNKFSWSWTPYQKNICGIPNTYDAQDILTHELGHWVGLDDEKTSDFVDNTMYGYGAKGEVKKDTLTTGDINGASGIYR